MTAPKKIYKHGECMARHPSQVNTLTELFICQQCEWLGQLATKGDDPAGALGI